MSFEYNGFIHRDLEPQVRYDAEQIQLLKQADIAINEKIDALPLGGEKVSLTFPAGASEGTITSDQLSKLQANESNYIEMVNDKELYTLNDNGHVEGYLTYSHVGIENSKATIKTLTITVSAKSFVIVTTVIPTDAGGKLYRHNLKVQSSAPLVAIYCVAYSSSETMWTDNDIFSYLTTPRVVCFSINYLNGAVMAQKTDSRILIRGVVLSVTDVSEAALEDASLSLAHTSTSDVVEEV